MAVFSYFYTYKIICIIRHKLKQIHEVKKMPLTANKMTLEKQTTVKRQC